MIFFGLRPTRSYFWYLANFFLFFIAK